ncbi:hypothetical protein [Streptomyces sp. NPDC002619]|uniref:hypothetical protein n=1 Tax=Streptomyces sp. NPDC002619 TaxID=3364655 RepID=UPI0036D14A46
MQPAPVRQAPELVAHRLDLPGPGALTELDADVLGRDRIRHRGHDLHDRPIVGRQRALVHARPAVRDQQHPARPRTCRHPLQLGGHDRIVDLSAPLGLNELPDHHLGGLQPGHLGIDLGELLAQPLGAVGQHHPPLHHPHQYIRQQQPLPTPAPFGAYEASGARHRDSDEEAARRTITC